MLHIMYVRGAQVFVNYVVTEQVETVFIYLVGLGEFVYLRWHARPMLLETAGALEYMVPCHSTFSSLPGYVVA
jgi:hypothetical protein